jgi:hypothetical protein
MASKLIMTPINLKKPTTKEGIKARTDYLREEPEFNEGKPKWDDTRYNKAKIGDLFAFIHQANNEDRMEIFEVVGIQKATDRPDYWDIDHHRNRNVLHLSPLKSTISFSHYKSLVGYSESCRIMGTCHGKIPSSF